MSDAPEQQVPAITEWFAKLEADQNARRLPSTAELAASESGQPLYMAEYYLGRSQEELGETLLQDHQMTLARAMGAAVPPLMIEQMAMRGPAVRAMIKYRGFTEEGVLAACYATLPREAVAAAILEGQAILGNPEAARGSFFVALQSALPDRRDPDDRHSFTKADAANLAKTLVDHAQMRVGAAYAAACTLGESPEGLVDDLKRGLRGQPFGFGMALTIAMAEVGSRMAALAEAGDPYEAPNRDREGPDQDDLEGGPDLQP